MLENLLAELTCGDDRRAEAAGRAFSQFPPELKDCAIDDLGELLASAHVDARWWAARALAELSHPGVPSLLAKALRDEDACVRQCAALGCRQNQDEAVIPALIAALSDEDQLVVELVADALETTGKPAVPALLEVLLKGNPRARLAAVRALSSIGDERAIPALMKTLEQGSTLMAYWAEEGLERMGVGMIFYYP